MARLPLPYRTKNELTRFLVMEQARRATAAHGNSRPSLKDLEVEMAAHCNVTLDTINLIRRNKNQPSLQVAMKIADFLNVQVEDVFELVENPDYKS